MIRLIVLLVLWAGSASAGSLHIPVTTNVGAGVLLGCHDGDTCTITIPDLPALFGERLSMRLLGIDTPEIMSHCPQEQRLAVQAKEVLMGLIAHGKQVHVDLLERDKYFRALARITVDGKDVTQELLAQKLAKPYDGGTKEPWCS